MSNQNEQFLSQLRISPIGAQIVADAENSRLARRRKALESLAAVKETEKKFLAEKAAVDAEFADAKRVYDDAEAALQQAASALYVVTRKSEKLCRDYELAENEARCAVLRERNPKIQELLFEPLRRAVEKARAISPESETKFKKGAITWSCAPVIEGHLASHPTIMATITFFEQAVNRAGEYLLNVDDTDAELARIREAILEAAPAVRLVPIELHRDGSRLAHDREISAAIASAAALAKSGFVVPSKARGAAIGEIK